MTARSRHEEARTLRGDVERLESELRELAREVQLGAHRCVEDAPLTAVCIAAGVGFALAGGLPRIATAAVFETGVKMAGTILGEDLASWVQAAADAAVKATNREHPEEEN